MFRLPGSVVKYTNFSLRQHVGVLVSAVRWLLPAGQPGAKEKVPAVRLAFKGASNVVRWRPAPREKSGAGLCSFSVKADPAKTAAQSVQVSGLLPLFFYLLCNLADSTFHRRHVLAVWFAHTKVLDIDHGGGLPPALICSLGAMQTISFLDSQHPIAKLKLVGLLSSRSNRFWAFLGSTSLWSLMAPLFQTDLFVCGSCPVCPFQLSVHQWWVPLFGGTFYVKLAVCSIFYRLSRQSRSHCLVHPVEGASFLGCTVELVQRIFSFGCFAAPQHCSNASPHPVLLFTIPQCGTEVCLVRGNHRLSLELAAGP